MKYKEQILEYQLAQAADHITWLLPFAKAKAAESGNIAGLVRNAEDFLCLPIVINSRLKVYET